MICAAEAMNLLPDELRVSAEHLILIARALHCLLCPRPHRGSGPQHTQAVMNYSGSVPLLVMMRDVLQKQQFAKMWDEVLAKDSATRQLMPIIESFEQELAQRPVPEELLTRACKEGASWKERVRVGALQIFEQRFHEALQSAAQMLIENEGGTGITLSYFDQVLAGLAMFQDPATMNLHGQLSKLETKMARNLVIAEVEKVLNKYPDPADPQADPKAAGDIERLEQLHAALCKCRDIILPDALVKDLPRAIFWHLASMRKTLQDSICHRAICCCSEPPSPSPASSYFSVCS